MRHTVTAANAHAEMIIQTKELLYLAAMLAPEDAGIERRLYPNALMRT